MSLIFDIASQANNTWACDVATRSVPRLFTYHRFYRPRLSLFVSFIYLHHTFSRVWLSSESIVMSRCLLFIFFEKNCNNRGTSISDKAYNLGVFSRLGFFQYRIAMCRILWESLGIMNFYFQEENVSFGFWLLFAIFFPFFSEEKVVMIGCGTYLGKFKLWNRAESEKW